MAIPIALQLYSIRHEAEKDLLGTIARVGDMRYDGVEFAGTFGVEAEAIRDALQKAGLQCAGAHVPMDQLAPEKLEATKAYYGTFGCRDLVIPWIPEEKRNSEAASLQTAKELTQLTEALAKDGFRTGFHAHDGDMRPLDGGQSAWDLIARNTPEAFVMQYDTANGMNGGADPVAPIRNHPGRSRSLHLKEYPWDRGQVIGEGDVPWSEVFRAAEEVGGTQWYVVEHEAAGERTPLESVEACLRNLREMGK